MNAFCGLTFRGWWGWTGVIMKHIERIDVEFPRIVSRYMQDIVSYWLMDDRGKRNRIRCWPDLMICFFIWYFIYICAISWAAEVVKKIWELINRYLFICYQTCWKMLEELEEIWIAFGDNSFWKCWMFEKNFCEIILLRILEIFCVVLFYEKRINASYIFYDNLKYFLRIILNNLQKNFCKSFSLLFRESLSK